MPQYVIDAPFLAAAAKKVPINLEYVLRRNAGRVLVRNYEGKIFEYPEKRRRHTEQQTAKQKTEEPDLCKC